MGTATPLDTKLAKFFPGVTAIGSLPHHNVDAALAFSFQLDIPFLPQIPIRNPWEFMIAQALEGMPGLLVDKEGSTLLDLPVWTGRSHAFNEKLRAAFENPERPDAFEPFEPSTAASSSWQPFLWELQERRTPIAKIQMAGPLTSQWALRLKDNTPAERYPEIGDQIYRLLLARAVGMCRRLKAQKIQPLLYLDEPALFSLNKTNPRHVMGLQQIKLLVQALKKEGVVVGLHCCSNIDWASILNLGLQIISLDCQLSLDSFLEHRAAVEEFLDQGGRLSLGVVPTSSESRTKNATATQLFDDTRASFARAWPREPDRVAKTLAESIYTPACGLALHSPEDAEVILSTLLEFKWVAEQILRR